MKIYTNYNVSLIIYAIIIKIKTNKDLKYFTLCGMNVEYMKV